MMFRSQDLEMGAIIHFGPNTFHSWRDVEPFDGFHPLRKGDDLIANFGGSYLDRSVWEAAVENPESDVLNPDGHE